MGQGGACRIDDGDNGLPLSPKLLGGQKVLSILVYLGQVGLHSPYPCRLEYQGGVHRLPNSHAPTRRATHSVGPQEEVSLARRLLNSQESSEE